MKTCFNKVFNQARYSIQWAIVSVAVFLQAVPVQAYDSLQTNPPVAESMTELNAEDGVEPLTEFAQNLEPTYLGKVGSDSDPTVGLEFYCVEGNRSACKSIDVYEINGVRASQPLAHLQVLHLREDFDHLKHRYRFGAVTRAVGKSIGSWSYEANICVWTGEGLLIMAGLIVVGNIANATVLALSAVPVAALVVAETVRTPISLVQHWAKVHRWKKAKQAVFMALSSGSTVQLKHSQYVYLRNQLEKQSKK